MSTSEDYLLRDACKPIFCEGEIQMQTNHLTFLREGWIFNQSDSLVNRDLAGVGLPTNRMNSLQRHPLVIEFIEGLNSRVTPRLRVWFRAQRQFRCSQFLITESLLIKWNSSRRRDRKPKMLPVVFFTIESKCKDRDLVSDRDSFSSSVFFMTINDILRTALWVLIDLSRWNRLISMVRSWGLKFPAQQERHRWWQFLDMIITTERSGQLQATLSNRLSLVVSRLMLMLNNASMNPLLHSFCRKRTLLFS